MTPNNYDWMNDVRFEVPSPEMLRRRRFWVRVYVVTAVAFLALGVCSGFFFN